MAIRTTRHHYIQPFRNCVAEFDRLMLHGQMISLHIRSLAPRMPAILLTQPVPTYRPSCIAAGNVRHIAFNRSAACLALSMIICPC